MNKELQDFYDNTVKAHIECMLKDKFSEKNITPPICYTLGEDGRVGMGFIHLGEGVSPMVAIKPIVAQLNPKAYLFCGEAWVKGIDKKDYASKEERNKVEKRIQDFGVRNEKDKFEILTAIIGTKSGEQHQRMYYIHRNKKNRIIKVTIRKKLTSGKLESRHTP